MKKKKQLVLEENSQYQLGDLCILCGKELEKIVFDGNFVYVKHSSSLSVCIKMLREEVNRLNEWRRNISEIS